jgi:hypothetical protein
MNNKKQKIIYWIGLGLTSLWFGASGFFEITRNPLVWDKTIALGYPAYFIITLGIAKLLGVFTLLMPHEKQFIWLKEWVFAALFFDIAFALISGLVIFGTYEFIAPFIAFSIVLTTYIMFRRVYFINEN